MGFLPSSNKITLEELNNAINQHCSFSKEKSDGQPTEAKKENETNESLQDKIQKWAEGQIWGGHE